MKVASQTKLDLPYADIDPKALLKLAFWRRSQQFLQQ